MSTLIESDSILAVGWFNLKKNYPWKLLNTLKRIDMLRKELAVLHIIRERNSLADYLAKKRVTDT